MQMPAPIRPFIKMIGWIVHTRRWGPFDFISPKKLLHLTFYEDYNVFGEEMRKILIELWGVFVELGIDAHRLVSHF